MAISPVLRQINLTEKKILRAYFSEIPIKVKGGTEA
jgi:hypothetical protein